MENERIINVPNLLTVLRGVGTALIVYMIFADYSKLTILATFIILAITDGIDGVIARRFNQKTRFGKYSDPVMDRAFMIIFVISFYIKFGMADGLALKLLPLILTREAIATPFYIFLRKFDIRVNVKPIGKLTTGLQSVTVPCVLLGLPIALFMVILTSLVGIASGITYANDWEVEQNVRTRRR